MSFNMTNFNRSNNLNYSIPADNFSNYDDSVCNEISNDCQIDHNIVCVGDPAYCNLTEDEYTKLLFEYIYPTIPEWILIFSHSIVFLMGLVSVY